MLYKHPEYSNAFDILRKCIHLQMAGVCVPTKRKKIDFLFALFVQTNIGSMLTQFVRCYFYQRFEMLNFDSHAIFIRQQVKRAQLERMSFTFSVADKMLDICA